MRFHGSPCWVPHGSGFVASTGRDLLDASFTTPVDALNHCQMNIDKGMIDWETMYQEASCIKNYTEPQEPQVQASLSLNPPNNIENIY